MQRRSRDIQIFNLSMMDVITGAMGAFLIVMIVLARYYNADPGNKENIEAIQAELESAQARLRQIEAQFRKVGINSTDIPSAIREATKDLTSAEKKTDALNDQLDQASAEIERLKETIRDMQKRRAFSVSASWDCPGADVDIYVWDSQISIDGNPVPPFDPTKEQWPNWTSDERSAWDNENSEVWLVTEALLNHEFKVFVNVRNIAEFNRQCVVKTAIVHSHGALLYTSFLSPSLPWDYISKVKPVRRESDKDPQFTISTPSDAEKAAERAKVSKT